MKYRIPSAWVALSLVCTLQAASEEEPAFQPESPIIFGTELQTFMGFHKSVFEYLPPDTVTIIRRDQDHPEHIPRDTGTITRRDQDHPDSPLPVCSYTIPACGNGDAADACEVRKVLSDSRLLDRLPAEGEKVFKGDPRHVDGSVNYFTTKGKGRLVMGNPCRQRNSECSEEDQIMQRLVDTFADLRRQTESSARCQPGGVGH